MSLVSLALIGLEDLQRATLLQVFDSLNDTIGEIESMRNTQDQDFAAHLGRTYSPTTLERVAPENFVEGHRPSLISAPITAYPNVAVMAVRATPHAENDLLDHSSVYLDLLIVEIMVKSEASEEEVNRRAQRMAEAVNACVMSDPTLGGVVHGFDTAPTISLSDVFTRKERTSYGPHWFWQGARLEYAVRKEAVTPSSSTGSVFRAAPSKYDIDQA